MGSDHLQLTTVHGVLAELLLDAEELERSLAPARTALGEERAARLVAAGRLMSVDEALRYALEA